jgi:MraZ protein
MFLSTYPLRLDEKGRFFLPSKYRPQLEDGLIIVQGQDDCLAIYPPQVFEQTAGRILEQWSTHQDVRAFQRMLGADAGESRFDKQGRVSVPAELREYAHLDRDIIVTGALDHAEIWNPDLWRQYRDAQQPEYSRIDKPIGQVFSGVR